MNLSIAHDLPRFGLKGANSVAWLQAAGTVVPEQPNTWVETTDGRVLRLGRSEFLVEGAQAKTLQDRWQDGQPGACRVPRHDACFVLEGEGAQKALSEICALDLRPEIVGSGVLMTLAAGISVTLVCAGREHYCLWCDATYGHYMHETLQTVTNTTFQESP